ncbi:MAG: hypothetical protein FWC41_13920, partial [Firmicutes bacterium]|nr:hypothetical protein [Bacillota bacterium]
QLGSSNVILEKAKKVDAKEILDTGMDSLAVPGSYQDIQLKLLTADVNVTDKSLKLEALQEDYYKKQATALKQRIWFISALSLLLVTLLILLYNRQRQKAKMEKITRLSEQRKNEYLLLQQDSEQKMIRKYVEGLETERERISKELHDGICNDLLALEMAFKNDISTKKEIQKHLDFLEKTRANIRHISHELMPPQFQYATIDEILKDYILQYNTTDKCLVKYYCDDDYNFANLSKELAFEIYRIVQETVGNAVKHAQASEIVLKLAKIDNEIQIFTSDNGKGFGKTKNYGYSISERVKSLNGSMDITSGEMGTSIKIAFNL